MDSNKLICKFDNNHHYHSKNYLLPSIYSLDLAKYLCFQMTVLLKTQRCTIWLASWKHTVFSGFLLKLVTLNITESSSLIILFRLLGCLRFGISCNIMYVKMICKLMTSSLLLRPGFILTTMILHFFGCHHRLLNFFLPLYFLPFSHW